MNRKIVANILVIAILFSLCTGCSSTKTEKSTQSHNAKLDTSEEIVLNVCGGWSDCKAIENASKAFNKIYPNCTVQYEYLQNYDESLVKRLSESPKTIDLFFAMSGQEDSPYFPYQQELYSLENVDLSNANESLVRNFTLKNKDESGKQQLYALPLGGELRGIFVNKTLLSKMNLEVPTNAKELLNACEVLKNGGYVPMNGNPGIFSQRLLYPYVCNLIANSNDYEKTYNKVNNCEEGVSELFREPMQMMYTLMENKYYNYKYVETEKNMFTDMSDEAVARDFFNIAADGNDYKKTDDVGQVAFMSGMLSLDSIMEKTKEDYHSGIDYEFILAPVSDEGGFAYVSPGHGISINKNSSNLDWAAEFFNFIFQKKENKQVAKDLNYIPNVSDSFEVVKEMYDIPKNRISDLGQATFDYDFYSIICNSLLETSKGNNPKYMNTDAEGNPVMYDFEYYMDHLETAFAEQRTK